MSTSTFAKEDVSTEHENAKMWNVVLLDSAYHSFHHVTLILISIFGKNYSDAEALTEEVHRMGRAIAVTCSEEEAIDYKNAVDAFGPDILLEKCNSPLPCTVEPAI